MPAARACAPRNSQLPRCAENAHRGLAGPEVGEHEGGVARHHDAAAVGAGRREDAGPPDELAGEEREVLEDGHGEAVALGLRRAVAERDAEVLPHGAHARAVDAHVEARRAQREAGRGLRRRQPERGQPRAEGDVDEAVPGASPEGHRGEPTTGPA